MTSERVNKRQNRSEASERETSTGKKDEDKAWTPDDPTFGPRRTPRTENDEDLKENEEDKSLDDSLETLEKKFVIAGIASRDSSPELEAKRRRNQPATQTKLDNVPNPDNEQTKNNERERERERESL